MQITKIDIQNWERREIYDNFSKISFPFYVVSFNVEIHNLYNFSKSNHIGIYHAMIWCITKAINSIPAFRQRIINNEIIQYSETYPSYTFLKENDTAFKVCTLKCNDNILEFDREAKIAEANQTSMYGDYNLPNEALFYLTCLPWIETSGISSERDINKDDCISRISWGKFHKNSDGTITQNISVDTNHRLIDGYHIGLFGQKLQEIINNL